MVFLSEFWNVTLVWEICFCIICICLLLNVIFVHVTCFKGWYQIRLFNLLVSLLIESRERDMEETQVYKSPVYFINYIVKIGLLAY